MKKTEAGREYIEFPHGSQVISIGTEYYETSPDKVAQVPGDMMFVNHDRWESGPAGNHSIGVHAGLGTMMKRRSCRLATPDDAGYLATQEEWRDHFKIPKDIKAKLFFWRFVAIFLFIEFLLIALK
ncbi:hypothetical protein [Citrobacter sp.]|uniref:hypothetical protein n=1 Tax=Citrobacter sp. TaxID=1896336 RepID=UPI002FC8F6DF